MFTGASTVLGADGETVSLARITNTVIGISIYLIIDLLLGGSNEKRVRCRRPSFLRARSTLAYGTCVLFRLTG